MERVDLLVMGAAVIAVWALVTYILFFYVG
jgi:hypothetical protein